MPKKYNLGSKSDMRKFNKDLEKAVTKKATAAARNKSFTASCPKCNKPVLVKFMKGRIKCPSCSTPINITTK